MIFVCLSVPNNSFCLEDLNNPQNAVSKILLENEQVPRKKEYTAGTVNLFVTSLCNLSCPFCCMRSNQKNQKQQDELTLQDLNLKILPFLKKINPRKIIVSGGEPFVNKDIFGIIDILSTELSSIISIQSNGLLVTEECLHKIAGKVSILEISTAHYGRNFEQLISLTKRIRISNINLTLSFVYNNKINELYKIIDLAAMRDAIPLIGFIAPVGSALDSKMLIPSSEEKLMVLSNIAKYVIYKGYSNLSIADIFFPCIKVQKSCGAYEKSVTIFPDSNVYPCHSLSCKEFLIGNLKEENFNIVFKKWTELMQVRDIEELFTIYGKKHCKDCNIKYICGGMCGAYIYNNIAMDCIMRKALLLFNLQYYNPQKTAEQNLQELVKYIDEKRFEYEILQLDHKGEEPNK